MNISRFMNRLLGANFIIVLLFSLFIFLSFTDAAPHTRKRDGHPNNGDQYLLGVGKADITGPVVEINLMGYANFAQKGTGLRQRLYSRSFIVASPTDPKSRFVYVIADLSSGDTAIRYGVLQKLSKLYPGLYPASNVAVVGTHSHSGPGAWLNYLLPQISTLGFDPQSYNAIVSGITLSIQRAHESLQPGYLTIAKGPITDASINRSPYAYDQNPLGERQKYQDNVDKEMTLLLFEDTDRKTLGLLNWFPTHGTSLYNNNTLVSGDNKGYAAIKMEKYLSQDEAASPDTTIVAGFSQANVGDVSPNTEGAVCQDTGLPCRYEDSTCNGKSELCHGRGPGFRISDAESCKIIGERQFEAARDIYLKMKSGEGEAIGGTIRSFHTFVDMGGYTFTDSKGNKKKTCKAALGFSFAAGTTDGPGVADFVQNDSGTPKNPLWMLVRNILETPSKEQVKCHKPKPILLDVGEMDEPYSWSPNIVDIQMLRVGQVAIIVSPGEATTMAGRRWREAVSNGLKNCNIPELQGSEGWVVLGGPANTYTHYITTPEEYDVQRYEGASTLYGRNTLDAYISLSLKYLPYLQPTPPSQPLDAGPQPPINTQNSINLNTPVVLDSAPLGKKFGQVIRDANKSIPYSKSKGDKVVIGFIAANPRNNLRLEGDFVIVEQKQRDGSWKRYRGDDDWELVFEWKRKDFLLGTSEVVVTWELEQETEVGQYRIRYFGDAKSFLGKVKSFEGVSGVFSVAE